MKSITIIGNLGANAVRKTASDGREFMTFNVAVSAGDSAVWFNCIGKVRDKLLQYLVKGQCVCVVGDLQARTYNGNLDLSISIDRIELCGKAPETTESEQTAQINEPI